MKLLITYISILFLLAVLPINGTDSTLNNNYIFNIRWDYLVHALVYIPLYPLMMLSRISERPNLRSRTRNTQQRTPNTEQRTKNPELKTRNIKPIILSLIIAMSLEAIQILTPWRTFNVNDLVGNVLGVGIGIVLWFVY